MNMILRYALGMIAAAIITFSGYQYWLFLDAHPSTDNAYVKANLIEVNANISGQVSKLYIHNNEIVKKNQLLLQTDSRALQIALHNAQASLQLTEQKIEAAKKAVDFARANIDEAKAQVDLDHNNAKRILALVNDGKLPPSEGDKFKASLKVSEAHLAASQAQYQQELSNLGDTGTNNAQLQQAKAQLDKAKLELAYTEIRAPANGKISHLNIRPGNMVQRGQSLFTLIEQNQWWVDANFKETKIGHIKPGQPATIVLDMYPKQPISGVVESISGGTGSMFSILPAENAAGNWVKVTQRIPVRIAISKQDFPLAIGASASVTVNTQ